MKILVFEPHKRPRREDVPYTLDQFHEIVGGYIQAIYPWEDRVAVVCDEEGLLKGYELNRYIAPGVVIAGMFFICGVGDEDFKVRMLYYRSDVNELLQGMDIFLFPSLYEGLGIALVNAQCAGLLCAASTNVPAESDVTGNVLFLDLELPGDVWARRIMDAYAVYERVDQSTKVSVAGYDCKTAYDVYVELMR